MERIFKKIRLEDSRTRTPGLMPFIPFNQKFEDWLIPTTSGVTSNWGGFPADFVSNGKTVSYAGLMRKYYTIRKILLGGIKLKSIQNNSNIFFTRNFSDWTDDRDGYTVCDISKFGVNAKKLYYIKTYSNVTSQTQMDELSEISEVGDICKNGSKFYVYYGSDGWIEIRTYVVLTNQLKNYVSLGGNSTRQLAEEVIGLLVIPNYIQGERVPDYLYYSQISSWIGMLKYFKSRGYCCQKDYERFGGDDMLTFLEEAVIPLPNYKLLVPSIKLPLFLRQNYSDVGILSTYDESMDFDYDLPENQGITYERKETSISAESKLTTLRSRKKVFNDETGALEDFIISGGENVVPYEIGGDANTANTFNTYYLDDGKYVGDYITKIIYLDDNGVVLPDSQKTEAKFIEFEYVIGGEFTGKPITGGDECDLTFLDLQDTSVFVMPATGGTIHFRVSGTCEWTAYIIDGDDEFLNLRHEDDYDVGGILTVDNISGFGSKELINIESNTSWRLVDIPDTVSFSRDYGFDYRDTYLTIPPYNSGGLLGVRTITAATVEYGSSYGNSKFIIVEQTLEYITINRQITYYWSDIPSASTSNSFVVNSTFSDWEVISTPEWCNVTNDNSRNLEVEVFQNDTIYPREGEIVIGKNGVYAILKLTQERGNQFFIDVFQIIELEDGTTGKSYDSIYLDGNEEALFGVEVYSIDNLTSPITPTPNWNYKNVSETFNNPAVVDSDNYIEKYGNLGFNFTNKFRGPGEAHGTVNVYLEDSPNVSASTQTIYLSKYLLYVAPVPNDCPGIDEQLRGCDYENGSIIDFCELEVQDFDVFTNFEEGWTVEIEWGPYLTIDYTSLTYDCFNSYQKVQVGSNITWYFSKEYVSPTQSVDDYQYDFEGGPVFEPTKEQKFAQMYERGFFVQCGEYVYVRITDKQYNEREDQEETYVIYTRVPVTNITSEFPKYIKVDDKYWMRIPTPDWCTVLPDNGQMDTEVGIFVDENAYNTRYLVLYLTQFGEVYDEDGNKIMVTPFKLFIIQEQCEEDEPEIIVDTDELIFTPNTDFARIQITSNIGWINTIFVEWDGSGATPGSDTQDPEYGMLPTKYALVSNMTDAEPYNYVSVYQDQDQSNNGFWKKVLTPPSSVNIVEDRDEWCTVIPEEGEGTQIALVFVRTNNSGDDRHARLLISEYGNTDTTLTPPVVKIVQLGEDDEAALYLSTGFNYGGVTPPKQPATSEDKQWFEDQYRRGIYTDGTIVMENKCNETAHVDVFTTVHEGWEVYIEFSEDADLRILKDGQDCTGVTFTCISELQTLNVEANCDWVCDSDFGLDEPWYYVVPSNGYGDQTVGVFVFDNPSNQERECDLIFTGMTENGTLIVKTVKIKQKAASAITIEPSNLSFGPQGAYQSIYLDSQNIGSWGVTNISNQSTAWCNVTPRTGVGSTTLTVRVSPNTGGDRSCVITFTGVSSAYTATVNVSQRGSYLMASPDSLRMEDTPDFKYINVDCNTVWSATSDADWCSVTPSVDDPHSDIMANKLLVWVRDNAGQERTCTVTIKTIDGSNITRRVTVTQNKSEGTKIDPPHVYLMAASKTGLTFGWDEVLGAESYDIYFDLASDIELGKMPTRVMDSFSGTAVTFTSLTSYVASTDDDRASVIDGKVIGYTPEDSWPWTTVRDEQNIDHTTIVYGLPNGTYFTMTGLTDSLLPSTEYIIGVVAHSQKGTAVGETLEGRFTIYTEPPGLDNEPVGPEQINSDYWPLIDE